MDIKKYAIIVAGGSGTRVGGALPKQFMLLKGKPVLYYSIHTFLQTFPDCEIILVLPEEHIGKGQEIIDAYFSDNKIKITIGGRTRFHSTQCGLALVETEDCIVFVHDAARPLVSSKVLKTCLLGAMETGSAIPVMDCTDSMRIVTEAGNEAFDRTKLKVVQTPQTFHGKIILSSFFNIDYKDWFTDEASVVEAFGLKLTLVEGDAKNFKITNPADFIVAEAMME
jgi:2-C-methyl-D-erythritol 4-phosphate cytidylyltransferase